MIGVWMTSAVLMVAPIQDTTMAVSRGDHLRLDNVSGEIVVLGWDRDEVALEGTDRDEPGLRIRRSGEEIRIDPERMGRKRGGVDARFRVPRWMDVRITGRSLDVDLSDLDGEVLVTTVRGDVRTEDTSGTLRLRSQQGEIEIYRADGRISASAQSDDITLVEVTGTVEVASTSGDIVLDDIDASSVRAETQDGDIEFSGELQAGGEYGFFVHDGDVVLALPESTSAVVSASTFDVEFESDFPVRLQRYRGGEKFDFTLGEGSARLEIHVFDGEIQLVRRRTGG